MTGGSGRFVGQFVETAVTWTPFAKNLSFEAGAAYLRPGQFAKDAPAEQLTVARARQVTIAGWKRPVKKRR